jgi:hypothetical protein
MNVSPAGTDAVRTVTPDVVDRPAVADTYSPAISPATSTVNMSKRESITAPVH